MFFSYHVKFSLVLGTDLTFTLSTVVLKIWHVEVDVIKSQDIFPINSPCIDSNYSLKAYQFVVHKCIHIFHLRK